MAEVNVLINRKQYGVACDDGQQNRVRELANYVDTRLREMIGDSTGLPESHILVLTSLILTDEIFDMRATTKGREQQYTEITHENHALKNAIQDLNQKITALEQEIAQAQTQPYSATDLDHSNQEELASTIQSMTIQIEKLAQKVASL